MKILVISPNPEDGTSWYRSNGPLAHLAEHTPNDKVQYVEYGGRELPSWDIIIRFDIIFLQRPYLMDHYRLANMAHFLGKVVWIDWDDYLWDIPLDNPAYKMYNEPGVKPALDKLLAGLNTELTLYTVTTKYMAQLLRNRASEQGTKFINMNVIPNAINEDLFFPMQFQNEDAHKIAWRGSDTHVGDVLQYKPQMDQLTKKFFFDFIGMCPWFLEDIDTGKITNHTPGGILQFYKFLREKKWAAFICMLKDSDFNRCKSNIVYLESIFAGAPLIAPAWEEFAVPGCINYTTSDSNGADIISTTEFYMAGSTKDRMQMWQEGVAHIEKNYTLAVTNAERYRLLTNLLNIQQHG